MAKYLYRVYALNEQNEDEVLIYDNLSQTKLYHLFDSQIKRHTPMITFRKLKDKEDWVVYETHKRKEVDRIIQKGLYKRLDS